MKKLRCFFVGGETLPIQCANILMARGHHIIGVMSSDEQLTNWAGERSIQTIAPKQYADAREFVVSNDIDLLFSIYNDFILPAELIEAPKQFSINYHDGPLPKYAGPNAAAWALLNRERCHGVAWHLMTTKVDAGDILVGQEVPIEKGDTAFSLNARCYEAAIESFTKLADDLTEGSETRTPQERSRRSFYSRARKPENFGIIDWRFPSDQIVTLSSALDFGPYYPNRFASAKIPAGDEYFIADKIRALKTSSGEQPGTILHSSTEGIQVATATEDVVIEKLRTLRGELAPIDTFLKNYSLGVGDRLPETTPSFSMRAKAMAERCAPFENYWIQRLRSLEPLRLREVVSSRGGAEKNNKLVHPIDVPVAVLQHLPDSDKEFWAPLLCAVAIFLGRFTREKAFDVAIQTPPLRELVGDLDSLFACWHPIRIKPDFSRGLASNIQSITKKILAAVERDTYALDAVGRLHIAEDCATTASGRLPICLKVGAGGKGAEQIDDVDITINVANDASSITLIANDHEHAAAASILASSLQTFLADFAARPDTPCHSLSIVTEKDRRKSIVQWNKTDVDYDNNQCIHHLFEEQALKTPDAPAVHFDSLTLTYSELNRRSNNLAHRLQRAGVGPESLVGVFMERSVEMVVALMATLKAGGAYLPLDPQQPDRRLQSMLSESNVRVVLTQKRLASRLPLEAPKAIEVDQEFGTLGPDDDKNPDALVAPNNLAYVIYTSGSTGTPKGVMNEHKGVTNRLLWMQDQYRLEPEDRILQKTPYSFDVSVWEFFWPLMTGASLVLAKPGGHRDPSYLAELIASMQITTIHFVPSMLRAFLEVKNLEYKTPLKRLFCSGEALSVDLQNAFFERIEAELHNLYGPTEAAIDVTYWACRPGKSLESVPIGRPVANTQIYILDERMQPLPIGVTGELFIGGVQVGRGYLNRPDLTEERFTSNPFDLENQGRLYRTGDLARFRADGAVEYLGRTDHQVKIRGVRIELEEIENTLSERSDVSSAVVVSDCDKNGDDRLIAYVVPDKANGGKTQQQGSLEKRIDDWRKIYDKNYSAPDNAFVPIENFSTWVSSYTGDPIPKEEMREWLEQTIERIAAHRPRKVFEIGCGMGLLLFRLAPHCEQYVATDFSKDAVEYVIDHLEGLPPDSASVDVRQREAVDFSGVEPKSFDTVIVNSVCQYFPSIDYFFNMLEGAMDAVADDGVIFLGDLRNLSLLRAFHASVELARAPADTVKSELNARVQNRITQENELLFDPRIFAILQNRYPRISDIRIDVKRSAFDNEMAKYRYDVTLKLGSDDHKTACPVWKNWGQDVADLREIEAILTDQSLPVFGITGFPNARLIEEFSLLDWLEAPDGLATVFDWRKQQKTESDGQGVTPDQLWKLALTHSYDVEVRWNASNDQALDIMFWKIGEPRPAFPTTPADVTVDLHSFANDPLASGQSDEFTKTLRVHLAKSLPEYMVPNAIVILDQLPLSPNGKLDRKALPAPITEQAPANRLVQKPRNDIEAAIASIWEDELGCQADVTESFFEIGGDSLKAVRLVAALEEHFRKELRLDSLFDYPTIEAQAQLLGAEFSAPEHDCLVEIRAGSPEITPLFLVHDADGETVLYRHLAERLSCMRPTYGLRPPANPNLTIEETAAAFIRAIRAVRPHGPYLLGGLCAGGVLAVEMAIQLRAEGEEAPLVAALDAADAKTPMRNAKMDKRLNRLGDLIKNTRLSENPVRATMNLVGDIGRRFRNAIAYEAANVKNLVHVNREYSRLRRSRKINEEALIQEPNLSTRQLYNVAAKYYTPGTYDGTIALFRASKSTAMDNPAIDDTPLRELTDDPNFGWRQRCIGEVVIFDTPGGHSSMLQPPFVDTLARNLDQCIFKALDLTRETDDCKREHIPTRSLQVETIK